MLKILLPNVCDLMQAGPAMITLGIFFGVMALGLMLMAAE